MKTPVFEKLQETIGYVFSNSSILLQALTHSSFQSQHNERLEFLGDGLLNVMVSIWLYEKFPHAREGDLSRLRANLVNEHFLSEMAETFQLGQHLRLGMGEIKTQGHQRPSILADAMEALIAAIYLDGGFIACVACVQKWYSPYWEKISDDGLNLKKDPKSTLQESLQAMQQPLPVYQIISRQGKSHQQIFKIQCIVEHWELQTEGEGTSRRKAEQSAAEKMLKMLKNHSGKNKK